MPFGDVVSAGRSTDQKYLVGDGLRKSFTGYERDDETGLNFAEARYYNDLHGRFTTVDPLMASGKSSNPQTFNRYVYAGNNPTLRVDPNGEAWYVSESVRLVGTVSARVTTYQWHSDNQTLIARVAKNYIVNTNFGDLQGLFVLDKWENRYMRVSSVAEGRAQFEVYREQAALNFIVGALEANSLILEFSDTFGAEGVERDSEQYKAGQNWGTIYQGLALGSGVGLLNAAANRFGKVGVKVGRSAASKILRLNLGSRRIWKTGRGGTSYHSVGCGRCHSRTSNS